MVVVSGLLALLWSYGLVVLFDMQMRLCDRIYDIIYIVNWNELCCHWNVMYDLLVNNSWLIPIAFWEIVLLVFETYHIFRYSQLIIHSTTIILKHIITLLLQVAKLANTKWCKKNMENLAHGYSSERTHPELSNEYPTWQGFRWFLKKSFSSCALAKSSLSIRRV